MIIDLKTVVVSQRVVRDSIDSLELTINQIVLIAKNISSTQNNI